MPRVSALLVMLAATAAAPCGPAATKPAVTALALAPGEDGLVRGSQSGVVWRARAGKDHPLPTKLDHVHALAFAPDGKTLAVAGGSPAESGAVELWSWPGRQLLGRLEGHGDVVSDVAWLRGNQLATASADRTVRLWDVGKRARLKTLSGHSGPVLALAVSPDGKWLCSGSADQTIRVWSAEGRLVRSLDNHVGPVHHLAFRPGVPEGRPAYLASAGGDGTVRVWQPAIGRMVRIVRQPAPALAVAWSPDGAKLYSGGKDGALRVIDADSDEILAERRLSPAGLGSLAVRRDGVVLAGDARGGLLLEDGTR